MLSRGLRKLAQPIKRFASVELKEVAAEGGFNYDVVLVATWTGNFNPWASDCCNFAAKPFQLIFSHTNNHFFILVVNS